MEIRAINIQMSLWGITHKTTFSVFFHVTEEITLYLGALLRRYDDFYLYKHTCPLTPCIHIIHVRIGSLAHCQPASKRESPEKTEEGVHRLARMAERRGRTAFSPVVLSHLILDGSIAKLEGSMPSTHVPKKNSRLILAERPARGPVTPSTFRREELDIGSLKDGEVLVHVEYSAIVSDICLMNAVPVLKLGTMYSRL